MHDLAKIPNLQMQAFAINECINSINLLCDIIKVKSKLPSRLMTKLGNVVKVKSIAMQGPPLVLLIKPSVN